MGRRLNKYEVVERLPEGAMTVLAYAEKQRTSKQNIYNKVRRGKNKDFKIVEFQKINFVLEQDDLEISA